MLAFASVAGAAGSSSGFETAEETQDCTEAVPATASVSGVLDDGRNIDLDVRVLLDGVTEAQAMEVMTRAQKAYSPLHITIRPSFQSVDIPPQRSEKEFPTDTEAVPVSDSDYLFARSKEAVGGTRPANIDVVYLLSSDHITGTTAGVADCIGGVRYAGRAFAIGERSEDPAPGGLALCCTWTTAKVAAHEIAHLLGAHHHYANCAEGAPAAIDDPQIPTCTLMINDIGLANLQFSTLEGSVVRGHVLQYADRPPEEATPQPQPQPSTGPSGEPPSDPETVTYTRSIHLRLARHLVARGSVDAGGAAVCAAAVDVKLQRWAGGHWSKVKSTTTTSGGAFRTALKDRAGRYRAVVAESRGTDGSQPYVCNASSSAPVRHRH